MKTKPSFRQWISLALWLLAPGALAAAPAGMIATAVEEEILAPLANPALLGVGNASGFGLALPFDKDGVEADDSFLARNFTFLANLGPLSYTLERAGDLPIFHSLALGLPLVNGLYAGFNYGWNDELFGAGVLGMGLVVRPAPFLSLGVKTADIGRPADNVRLGAGFRPLAFFAADGPGDRLTVTADLDYGEGFGGLVLGASAEPVDGLVVRGWYDFDSALFGFGLDFKFGPSGFGARMNAGDSRDGLAVASLSMLDRRSLTDAVLRRTVEYGQAERLDDVAEGGWFFSDQQTLSGFLDDMRKIRRDARIEAVVFRDQAFMANLANIIEARDAILEVRAAGKRIYFYFENASRLAYALAAATADEIVLAPSGAIDARGFAYANLYWKDFLADWGVQVVNLRSHDHKTGGNPLSESDMSGAEREAMLPVIRSLNALYVSMIRDGRGTRLRRPADEIVAHGPFLSAEEALELGLVDRVEYPDQFDDALAKAHPGARKVRFGDRGETTYAWRSLSGPPRVALVYASGSIVGGRGRSGRLIAQETMVAALRSLRNDPAVAGIILRIHSGGGTVLASDLIAREIELAVKVNRKPVVVSMGGTAASGGYYIAARASAIIASPATLTGSIGVIGLLPNAAGLLDKLKLNYSAIRTADNADFATPLKPVSETEVARLRAGIAAMYDNFIELVAQSRNLDKARVHELAQGRVWSGEQALQHGLVDRLGGLTTAVEEMRGRVANGGEIEIVEIVPGAGLEGFDLRRAAAEAVMDEVLGADLSDAIEMLRLMSNLADGSPLYLMPEMILP